ncbi:MAG: hypothetical protein U9N59_00095 [Campylobacterota bacterium]|nr:hypothetical protein [Campylobacterota bacterium]
MSKIKDEMSRAEDVRLHYHISFMEHLYEMMPQQLLLCEDDIIDMQRVHNIEQSQLNEKYNDVIDIEQSNVSLI